MLMMTTMITIQPDSQCHPPLQFADIQPLSELALFADPSHETAIEGSTAVTALPKLVHAAVSCLPRTVLIALSP